MASACAIAAATVLVLRFVHPFNAELAKVVIVTAISTGLLASLGGFVLTTGLARAFSDDAPLPAERTRGRELFAGACAAFVLGLFLMFYSPRLIPPLVSPQRLEVGGGIDGSVALGPGWPDVTYVKLDATADGWTRVDLPSADVANVADVQLDGNPPPPGDGKSYFAFITAGPHTLAFSNDAAWQGTKQSGTFAIASIPFLKDKNVILQTPHGPIIMQLPLARDGMKKTGRVQVTVDPALIAGRAADKLQLRARVVGSIGAAPSLSFATLRITGGHSQEAARPFGGMTTMMSAPANFLSDDPTLNDNGWHLDINSDRGVTIDATIDYTQSDPSVKGLRRFSNQWSLDHEPASLLLALDVIDAGTAIAVRQIVLDKFQAEQLNNRAWLLHQTGNDKNAYDLATQATSLDDSQAAYQDTLAHTAYATGRYAEAVKAWDRVLQLDPKFYTPLRDAECARDKDLLATARQKASAKP